MEIIKNELKKKIGDDKLVENLFYSFQRISEEYVAQKPVDLLQSTGLFVESALRIIEQLVLSSHVPLTDKFDVDTCIMRLEKASGFEGLRIHAARLCRSIYDFRSRKTAVHLKATDPHIIDSNLIFNISTWIFIEILKDSDISNREEGIHTLFTRRIPLVQSIGKTLRTTDPKLNGTQRILLLLYSVSDGLTETDLLESTKQKIKNIHHLQVNLKNMDRHDLVNKLPNSKWALFGRGFTEAEKIIAKFTK